MYTHTRLEAAVTVWWWKRGGGRDLPSEKESKLWWCQRERGEAFFLCVDFLFCMWLPPPFQIRFFEKQERINENNPASYDVPTPRWGHTFFSLWLFLGWCEMVRTSYFIQSNRKFFLPYHFNSIICFSLNFRIEFAILVGPRIFQHSHGKTIINFLFTWCSRKN